MALTPLSGVLALQLVSQASQPAAPRPSVEEQYADVATLVPWVAGAAGLVILVVIVALILRKLTGGQKLDDVSGVGYLAAGKLKQSGLVSDAEMAAIRRSMIKQVDRQRQAAGHVAPARAELLLADPEVQRLEAEAEAKRGAPLPDPLGQSPRDESARYGVLGPRIDDPPHANRAPAPAPGQAAASAASAPEIRGEAAPRESASAFERPIFSPPARTAGAALAGGNDVALPPDVVKMAELGLISTEELERIKERVRAKRSEIG